MTFVFPIGLNPTQKSTIAFLNGLNEDGTLATTDFANWNGDTPATYGQGAAFTGKAQKWQIGGDTSTVAVGTGGGTVNVYFDPGSNWTAAEKQSFLNGLTLWSDYADIKFSVVSTSAAANFTFYRYGTATVPSTGPLQTGAYVSNQSSSATDTSMNLVTSGLMSIQTTGGWTDLTSYSTYGGYGISTIVHEEGHLLGLGHAGPYNGNVNAATQQFNAYDTRLYSTMSYIDAGTTTAQYFNQYAVTGTAWGTTDDGYSRAPYTPQMLDILAAQQLYGTSTSTTFNGGQVFGFNCNISDATKSFFDFTVDATPVVTLWDRGTGNTLDLSGYATASVVNLNQGAFSSAAGLTNNIAIAYGTAIDRFVGGAGDDTITVNGNADIIDGGGGTNTVVFAKALASYTIGSGTGTVTITDTSTNVIDTVSNVNFLKFTDQTVPACFAAGTRIRTTRGDIEVEALAEGDIVRTLSGSAPVRWIGRGLVNCTTHQSPREVWPIRVAIDAFGPNQPSHPLYLSPLHAVLCQGVLVPIGHLVNSTSITQVARDTVTYFHIALARHDVILAENLPCETLLDLDFAGGFDNVDSAPEFLQFLEPCAPIIRQGPQLEAIRQMLTRETASASF